MSGIAAYIVRGRVQAAGVASVFAILTWVLPPLSYLSGAAIALYALRYGPREGALVATLATLVLALMAWVALGSPLPALAMAIVLWLPVLVCAAVLRGTSDQGALLMAIGAMALLFAVAMRVGTGDAVAFWREWMSGLEAAMTEAGMQVDSAVMDGLAKIMNGIVAAALVMSMMVTIAIARWWQAQAFNPGGFRKEFHALRLPRGLAIAVGGAALYFMATGADPGRAGLVADLLMAAVAMYLFQGLAIAHSFVARRGLSVGWLVAMYALTVLLPPYGLMLLATIGISDSFMNYRRAATPE